MATVLMDTREKIDKKVHILDYFVQNSVGVIRQKLDVGDWMNLDDPTVSVDTKTCGMLEVYSNLVTGHDRFRRECVRAMDSGVKLIILIEDENLTRLDQVPDWINPRTRKYELIRDGVIKGSLPMAPPVSSKRLHTIMRTMTERYGVTWDFCPREKTGERLCEILGLWPASSGNPSPP